MKCIKYVLILILFSCLISKTYSFENPENTVRIFNAKINKSEVEINFVILNPANVSKYKIESRKTGDESFKFLSDVLFSNFRKKENSDSANLYYYIYNDKPSENGVYIYRLSIYDLTNKLIKSEEIKIGISEVPEFENLQNNPNPFNPATQISYKLLVPTYVKLSVYSLTGKYVDLLVDEFQSPGLYKIDFNASSYSQLSSGIYFYKLESGYTVDIGKMIFTK
ncbi:MAG: T9SS type A sorting domain-containing protein [Ignavibacteria bacterium]|nr:T9SS type A sorting domain-containing protein [Ignavibacteria bacterium]